MSSAPPNPALNTWLGIGNTSRLPRFRLATRLRTLQRPSAILDHSFTITHTPSHLSIAFVPPPATIATPHTCTSPQLLLHGLHLPRSSNPPLPLPSLYRSQRRSPRTSVPQGLGRKRGILLGSVIDAACLGEIPTIWSLVLVPALVCTHALDGTCPC